MHAIENDTHIRQVQDDRKSPRGHAGSHRIREKAYDNNFGSYGSRFQHLKRMQDEEEQCAPALKGLLMCI